MAPLIIPFFLPHLGCQEQCLFCNQKAKASGPPSPCSLRTFIESSLSKLPKEEGREKQVAFYGGSFTALPKGEQIRYLKEIQPFLASGQIDSIRISTRPDALDGEILSLLKVYKVKTIEIGVQSMINEVLALVRRGHHAEDTIEATQRLKKWDFEVGFQLMIGLLGDSLHRFLQTLDQVIELQPNFVRIHPTLVLKGAPLADLWKAGKYHPLSLNETIQWLKKGLLKLERSSIPVARIGLQPTEELEMDILAGPYHPSLHQLIDSAISFEMAEYLLNNHPEEIQPLFLCPSKEISNLRGQRNENLFRLKTQFKLKEIFIDKREDLPRGYLGLQTKWGKTFIHKNFLLEP